MKTIVLSVVQNGSLVPHFDLPATKQSRAELWGYKGNLNLAVFFIPDAKSEESQQILRSIADHYTDYASRNTEVIVISKDNIETLDRIADQMGLPYPLASDITGGVTEKYTVETPSVFVIDRFGELYDQEVVDSGSGGFDNQRALDWLHLIELQCPECGVPTWRV